ncbi:site-specific integrase [Streptomyces galilaeus]|uniref:hypothetical protein n=1 Tax=Streptomyces galilaeus TaxID=33899 RepID=UPI0038F6C996
MGRWFLSGCQRAPVRSAREHRWWTGNLRARLLFALLAETGMRLGEALGLRISDFVMGRGGTPHAAIVPREGNPNGTRVTMMRPRRVYAGTDLERCSPIT